MGPLATPSNRQARGVSARVHITKLGPRNIYLVFIARYTKGVKSIPRHQPYSIPCLRWTNLVCFSKPSLSISRVPSLPWKGLFSQRACPTQLGACARLPAFLTCAPAGPVEELPWPPLSVVLVAQDVRTAPGPGVDLHLRALAPALPRAADVGRVGAQRRAALLGLQAAHRHADPGELRPHPRRERTAQAAEQKPPSKGAHGFITGRTLSRLPLLASVLLSSCLPLLSTGASTPFLIFVPWGFAVWGVYFCFAFYSSPLEKKTHKNYRTCLCARVYVHMHRLLYITQTTKTKLIPLEAPLMARFNEGSASHRLPP